MLKYLTTLMLIILLAILNSCDFKSEYEKYQEIMGLDKPEKRVLELKTFLEKYPENKNKERILRTLFRDYVNLNDEKNAVYYADQYLNFFPKDYRMSQLNGVAWTLAEAKLGMDSAKVYADRAVEQANESGTRTLNNIKDTQAYVYFQANDAKRALSIQLDAMEGNEDDYDFLSRLGLYQHDAGELLDSYYTSARSILLGAGLEAGMQLSDWLEKDYKDENSRNKIAETVAEKSIKEYLANDLTLDKKSQSAFLLSVLKVNLKKAENWAKEALDSLNEDSEFIQQLNYSINLASVYIAAHNQSEALKLLEDVKDYASIYDTSYWLYLGNAYVHNNQNEKAISAYINGMLWRQSPLLVSAAIELGLTDEQVNQKIQVEKEGLRNFHPGKYASSDAYDGRIVLAELFTGAECPPCKGADLAMDLIAEYYPRSMVTILEYHLHIPGPDPLTNPDTETRYKYYGKNFGTPTVFFNGKGRLIGGGDELVVRDSFNKYKRSIEKYFPQNPVAKINLKAKFENKTINVDSKIALIEKINDELILNIAVVEKSVDYSGRNGITKHAFVVRYLLSGGEGEKINSDNQSYNFTKSIALSDIEQRQSEYLTKFANDPPKRFRNFTGWNEKKEKLSPENLAIIAWVQNSQTNEILQSQYVEL